MATLIVIAVIISGGAFVFSNNVLPLANLKLKVLLADVTHQKPALNIKEGIFYTDIEGYSIMVGKKSADNKTIEDIKVFDHSGGKGIGNRLIAQRGEMFTTQNDRFLVLRLYDGKQYSETQSHGPQTNMENLRTYFKTWEKYFDLSQFTLQRSNEKFWAKGHEMLNINQLQNSIDTIQSDIDRKKRVFAKNLDQVYSFKRAKVDSVITTGKVTPDNRFLITMDTLSSQKKSEIIRRAIESARRVKSSANVTQRHVNDKSKTKIRHELAWHRKFTFSVACFVLFFIGAPMGAIIRIGGLGMPLVVSVLFFVVFYALTIAGQKIAEEAVLSPAAGSWLATAVLLPTGIFLTHKAMHDSALFSPAVYYKIERFLTRIRQAISR
jgi:lipopolysaccharide export system permease protein